MGTSAAKTEGISIEVRAIPAEDGSGFIGQVLILELPAGTVALRERVLASGRAWTRAQLALDAAYARGQQFARGQWRRLQRADEQDGLMRENGEVFCCPGYSLTGWQFDRNGDVQLPPSAA